MNWEVSGPDVIAKVLGTELPGFCYVVWSSSNKHQLPNKSDVYRRLGATTTQIEFVQKAPDAFSCDTWRLTKDGLIYDTSPVKLNSPNATVLDSLRLQAYKANFPNLQIDQELWNKVKHDSSLVKQLKTDDVQLLIETAIFPFSIK